MQGKQDFGKVP